MPYSRYRHLALRAVLACACLATLGTVSAVPASGARGTGGAAFVPPPPPPQKAMVWHGRALAPASAPTRIKRVIEAANQIINKPYRYGGGHRPFGRQLDTGYDCSGSVSHALHGGGFLRSPLPSGALMNWGLNGPGRWMTVYTHGGHAYLVVAGLRFDTSMRDPDAPGPATGPRWSRTLRRSAAFVPRHPRGY